MAVYFYSRERIRTFIEFITNPVLIRILTATKNKVKAQAEVHPVLFVSEWEVDSRNNRIKLLQIHTYIFQRYIVGSKEDIQLAGTNTSPKPNITHISIGYGIGKPQIKPVIRTDIKSRSQFMNEVVISQHTSGKESQTQFIVQQTKFCRKIHFRR
ncbi:hypothetical protein SDC9_137978 [bioreactor metagenome]|uniref:Uncharacterized protein n=1 Tax=bioreactor metagenome TaxID=1076179 RepID=A0A645DNN4_9ZZZZ